MAKAKKKQKYYEVTGKMPGDSSTYKLGYTSSKAAFTKEYVKNGWKASWLHFKTLYK